MLLAVVAETNWRVMHRNGRIALSGMRVSNSVSRGRPMKRRDRGYDSFTFTGLYHFVLISLLSISAEAQILLVTWTGYRFVVLCCGPLCATICLCILTLSYISCEDVLEVFVLLQAFVRDSSVSR